MVGGCLVAFSPLGYSRWKTGRIDSVLEVSNTHDRYALSPTAASLNVVPLLGKTVTVNGVLPRAPKGKLSDTLRYKTITEVR
jgi:hypothetical protein